MKGLNLDFDKFRAPDLSFDPPELNQDFLDDFEPVMPEMLQELKKNNDQLRIANENLFKELQDQHTENQKNQRSSSRLATVLSLANIALVALSLYLTFRPARNSETLQQLTKTSQELLKSSLNTQEISATLIELQNEIDQLESDKEALVFKIDSLKNRFKK